LAPTTGSGRSETGGERPGPFDIERLNFFGFWIIHRGSAQVV
jgi:hypothetical protein